MRKLIIVALLLPLLAWAQSPFDGKWKLNTSHAQLSETPETFALENGEYTCSSCIPKTVVKADGTDQKVAAAKDFDTLSVKQIDDKTVQFTRKKDGKVVSESTETVSSDGKTLTSDFKEYPPESKPIAGKYVRTRVSPGAAGSHAISGSWKAAKLEDVSEDALTFTLKGSPDGLSMQSGTGESYDAKFDGKDYPVKSPRPGRTISLHKVNDTTIEETYKEDGKPVSISRVTVTGNTLKYVSKDPRRGTTMSFTADRQ